MSAICHPLDGLEPDNLLAFLALLGLLRGLEMADTKVPQGERLYPRAGWTLDAPRLRPMLMLHRIVDRADIAERAVSGLDTLIAAHEFADRADLNYSRADCRALLCQTAVSANVADRDKADLLAALMSDASVKDEKNEPVEPTPLCLLFGQGHQHFLERLAKVPRQNSPPPRGRGRQAVSLSASACLEEAIFHPWHRNDPTFSFRWDPAEDVRYALMAGDPTDSAYKPGTQHGANRLAAVGLAALTMVPQVVSSRVRPRIIGGLAERGVFSFAWPVWRGGATLTAIRGLLAHPQLRIPGASEHLGVELVFQTQRISVGKFMNFSRARPMV